MKWICINCSEQISPEDFNCPYCGYQQYLDGFNPSLSPEPIRSKNKTIKISKTKSALSGAEVLTGFLKRDDPGYLAFLATRLFSD